MESKYNHESKDRDIDDLGNGLSKVTVVENENRRDRAISYFPKEVSQVCKDIACFFKADDVDQSRSRSKSISNIDGPTALHYLLEAVKESDEDEESVWFFEYKLLPVARILEIGSLNPCGLVPFAENIDGDYLATGQNEHSGGVFCVSADGHLEGDREAASLAVYLETYRDDLLSNKLEYIEDCGMVERAPTAPPSSIKK